MSGYVLRHATSRRYLEYSPYLRTFTWLAPFPEYATVFSDQAAAQMTAALCLMGDEVTTVPDARTPEDLALPESACTGEADECECWRCREARVPPPEPESLPDDLRVDPRVA